LHVILEQSLIDRAIEGGGGSDSRETAVFPNSLKNRIVPAGILSSQVSLNRLSQIKDRNVLDQYKGIWLALAASPLEKISGLACYSVFWIRSGAAQACHTAPDAAPPKAVTSLLLVPVRL